MAEDIEELAFTLDEVLGGKGPMQMDGSIDPWHDDDNACDCPAETADEDGFCHQCNRWNANALRSSSPPPCI
jgi:hypothetical protein